ncbi:MAG: glycoside hydrolase family 43 protein [Ferruginibacter sp.]|nr:glycoside hydrolase family 43 protein [Ferruginibacter sp.]
MKLMISSLLLFISLAAFAQADSAFLFSYFKNNGQDGLHLAYSRDGYSFTALKNDSSFLHPELSKDKLMRDPCIIRGADNKFHLVWTVSWTDGGIGYANSPDLVNWSSQQYLPVMAHESTTLNAWAPEIAYDDVNKRYMIYWASTIPGRFPATDSSGDGKYNHRMYYTTTKDFTQFTKTSVLYDHGFTVIDATIQKAGDEYIMFLKDETKLPSPQKNIRIATCKKLTGNYSQPSTPITGKYWAEGPTAIYTGKEWIVYFDKYTQHSYGAVTSVDLKNWQDVSDRIKFPQGTRHGTVLKISEQELAALLKQ